MLEALRLSAEFIRRERRNRDEFVPWRTFQHIIV